MTTIVESDETLEVLLTAEIDAFLAEVSHVTIVESSRVVDFALDLRRIVNESTS